MMHIAQLLGHGEQRARHDAHRLRHALMLIDHLMGQRIGLQPLGDALQHRIAHLMHRPAHPALERGAGEAQGFGGAQHGRLDVMVVSPEKIRRPILPMRRPGSTDLFPSFFPRASRGRGQGEGGASTRATSTTDASSMYPYRQYTRL